MYTINSFRSLRCMVCFPETHTKHIYCSDLYIFRSTDWIESIHMRYISSETNWSKKKNIQKVHNFRHNVMKHPTTHVFLFLLLLLLYRLVCFVHIQWTMKVIHNINAWTIRECVIYNDFFYFCFVCQKCKNYVIACVRICTYVMQSEQWRPSA